MVPFKLQLTILRDFYLSKQLIYNLNEKMCFILLLCIDLRHTISLPRFTPHYRISDSITYEQASLAEPLSVVLHASRRADLRAGQTVLVLGAGPVGLLACLMARACGASKVALADLDARRLEFAKSHSFASHYVEIPRGPRVSGQEALDEAKKNATLAKEAVGLTGFDVVFECTGAEPAIQLAIYVSIITSSL